MSKELCDGCGQLFSGHSTSIEISNESGSVKYTLSGHNDCLNELHEKILQIKDLKKKSPDKILKELGIESK